MNRPGRHRPGSARARRLTLGPMLALAGLSCSSKVPAPLPTDASAQPRRGGVLQLATSGDIRSLDPASISDGIAPEIASAIFAGLVDYDPSGALVPDLAERFGRSTDGLRFDFWLRRGLRFHDGAELTTEDVRRSLERALGPGAPNPSRSLFESLRGFAAFTSGQREHLDAIEVLSPHHLRLHLDRPDATFERALPLLALRPVCPSMGARWSETATPCGAGPFRLEHWSRSESVHLRRHEAFHGQKPWLDGVRWSLRVSALSQRFRFESGELHVLREMSAIDEASFVSDPRWRPYVHERAPTQMNAEGMNTEMPPFDNPDVRRAVSFAVDREAYARLRPHALLPLNQPVPQGVLGHQPTLHCQRFDLEQARALMAKAGYPYDPVSGRGGYPAKVPYVAYKRGMTEFTAQLLKQQLAQIGIRLELKLVSYATYLALSHRRGGAAMSYQGWSMDFSDPSNFTEALFHSRAIDDEDSTNTAFYSNPALDRLLDRAKVELDPSARMRLYDQAQQMICDDAPWVFTTSIRWTLLNQPFVRDYTPHVMWMHDLRSTWLDKPEAAP